MQRRDFFVYIMASRSLVLYVGMTSDLAGRVFQHKEKVVKSFTSKYQVNRLVYFERYDDVNEAILRERRIKKWKRRWKIELIESVNPTWADLYGDLE
jgi:putative endonuclease